MNVEEKIQQTSDNIEAINKKLENMLREDVDIFLDSEKEKEFDFLLTEMNNLISELASYQNLL